MSTATDGWIALTCVSGFLIHLAFGHARDAMKARRNRRSATNQKGKTS